MLDPIVRLQDIAHTRSGDKGNHANLAVIAYRPAGFAWLRKHLTSDLVQRFFAPMGPKRVERFEAPNVLALNFVLYDVLAGGASRSLRIDSQGKALASALLQMELLLDDPLMVRELMGRKTKSRKDDDVYPLRTEESGGDHHAKSPG